MNFIIGSGPAGIACAHALLERGQEVTLLDIGLELEFDRQGFRSELAATPRDQWTQKEFDLARKLRGEMKADRSGIPRKLAYGSDYSFRDFDLPLENQGTDTIRSGAQGGLSSLWGAALLPYSERDIQDWPIGISDLSPHYQAIHEFLPLAGVKDELESHYPIYSPRVTEIPQSEPAQFILSRLRARGDLLDRDIRFGSARLAVRENCQACTLCLYGCPYELIYDSSQTLHELQKNPDFAPRFNYEPGVKVLALSDFSSRAEIEAQRGDKRIKYSAEKVFLAAGPISTAQILYNSGILPMNHGIELLTSQHFVLPLLLSESFPKIHEERLHTLSQIFLEWEDLKKARKTIHLQIYTYNDLFRNGLRSATPGFIPNPVYQKLESWLLKKLAITQGYLPSEFSPKVSLDFAPEKIQARPIPNPKTRSLIRKTLKRLSKLKSSLGARPVSPGLQVSIPGGGSHFGGFLPMKIDPSEGSLESDRLGRPSGCHRIHVVDASIFPSIPATTLTYTIMANAHRIGANV